MFGSIGYTELILLGIVAVLLFGKRLPEVARTVGSSYQQFKKGLADLQTTIQSDDHDTSGSRRHLPDYRDEYEDEVPVGPRFESPPADDHKQ